MLNCDSNSFPDSFGDSNDFNSKGNFLDGV